MLTQILIPAQKKHAIVAMALGVDFKKALDSSKIQQLAEVYESSDLIKKELPVKAPLAGVSFSFESKTFLGATEKTNGYDFREIDVQGNILWNVSVRPDFIACNCMAYDRWNNVKEKAISLLVPFLERLQDLDTSILAIGLEYQDLFTAADAAPRNITNVAFKKDTDFLPRSVFEHTDAWHVHHGWFQKSPKNRRTLNNLQIEVESDKAGKQNLIKVNGQHKLYSFLSSTDEPMDICISDLDQILSFLHQINKDVLIKLLSEDLLSSINIKYES